MQDLLASFLQFVGCNRTFRRDASRILAGFLSRQQLRGDITNARRVLSGATVGAAVLSLAAAIAVALGLWPRMSEYR